MAQILRLYQSSTTLADFQVGTDFGLLSFSEYGIGMGLPFGQVKLNFTVVGTSLADLFDNLIALGRALKAAERNAALARNNQYYIPIWLQFQPGSSSNTLQTECFGIDDKDSQGAIENILAHPQTLLANRLENLTVTLKVRGYWEETAAVSIASGASQANGPSTSTLGSSSARGDLPMPLKVLVRTPTASQSGLIVAMRTLGSQSDVTSFSVLDEIESYTTFGSNVANLADTNLSPTGAGTTGKRWTPASTSEQLLARLSLSITVARLGKIHLFLRCRDNNATANVKVRARAGLTDGTQFQYGDYATEARFVDTVAGTTAISLIDLGVLDLTPFQDNATLGTTTFIEIRGQALSIAGSPTFDLDCTYKFPCNEDAMGNGFCIIKNPTDGAGGSLIPAGTGAAPDFVLDANDRVANAYLESSSKPLFVIGDIKGSPLMAPPNQQFLLYCLTYNASNVRHTLGTNTITVTGVPRYKVARGS